MAKYIEFRLIETKPKTKVFEVMNIKGEYPIGVIKWYPTWRQYCFLPNSNTVFSIGCLDDIREFVAKL